MKLALKLSPDRSAIYSDIGSRFSETFCKDASPADAVVTNHIGDARAAVNAGKHVLMDSNLAIDRSLQGAKGVVMPGYEWRFVPAIATVQESLASGQLGEPGLLRIHRWRDASGADVLRALLISDLDIATWMFGKEPDSIYIARRPDYLQLHLGFDGGGMAVIDHATARPAGTDYDSLTIVGSTGAAYADDHHNMNLLLADDRPSPIRVSQGNNALIAMVREFFAAISESREPSVTMDDLAKTLKLAATIGQAEGRIR